MQVKYKAPRFGIMSTEEQMMTCKVLMLKIHVIMGWTIPDEEFQVILVDQFTKKLSESYSHLNYEEVEYAFRNCTGVEDYGKAMNLSLIDKVLTPYLAERRQISYIEERLAKPEPQKTIDLPMSDEELLTATLAVWKYVQNYDIIPESLYYYLLKEGRLNLTNEQKKEISNRVYPRKFKLPTHWVYCKKLAVEDYFKQQIILNNKNQSDGNENKVDG